VSMRLGGPIFEPCPDPGTWAQAVRRAGYRAAYCPLAPTAADDTVRAYARAAAAADIVIGEVGAWSNPLSPDAPTRQAALDTCIAGLALAERIGARCCVNIAGSRGTKWDGPCPLDLAPDSFDLIVEMVRAIIDAVKPSRTFYTLETMPWMLPDSAAAYLRLLRAVDRQAFAVHLDPVNLVNAPALAFDTARLLRDCFVSLGPYIRSCHAKDILLGSELTVHLDEVRPGLGSLDYAVYLHELSRLEPDVTLLIEHLPSAAEFTAAADHIRAVAAKEGIPLG
jgi:sugar phosphate isomerase/epimerase